MTQKITINRTSTDRFPSAQSPLRVAGVDRVELGGTQQAFDIEDRVNSIDLQFTSRSAPIREQWIGLPTKTISDGIPENENQDWPVLFPVEVQSRIHVGKELAEIREEVKETCEIDSEVSPVPEPAYNQTISLLEQMPRNIPVPDIMWLERGGIGLEWRPGNCIVTMSLYGDNHVNFVAILGKQYEIAVTCPLSDQLLLPSFIQTLSILFQKRT